METVILIYLVMGFTAFLVGVLNVPTRTWWFAQDVESKEDLLKNVALFVGWPLHLSIAICIIWPYKLVKYYSSLPDTPDKVEEIDQKKPISKQPGQGGGRSYGGAG